MTNGSDKELYQSLIDRLENLKVELFENSLNVECIRLISEGLDNLLVKLIVSEKLQDSIEEELRLLINHLNEFVLSKRSINHKVLRIKIKYLILKSKRYLS